MLSLLTALLKKEGKCLLHIFKIKTDSIRNGESPSYNNRYNIIAIK